MNKMIIKVGLFFLFFLTIALIGRFLPNTLSKQASTEAGQVFIKEIKKKNKSTYEVKIVKKNGQVEKKLTDTDREKLDFYMINLEKPTINNIKAKATFKGNYTFTSKNNGNLVVVEADNLDVLSFDKKSLINKKEEEEFNQDYLMTKKIKGVTFTFIYKRLVEKVENRLQLHIEGNKKIECEKIYIMDTALSMFSIKEESVKNGKIMMDISYPHKGMYVLFFIMKINGEEVAVPFKLNVNEAIKK
ncbi:MAG: hypothetical protein ACI35O_05925 [Bacillaceae bacterium]